VLLNVPVHCDNRLTRAWVVRISALGAARGSTCVEANAGVLAGQAGAGGVARGLYGFPRWARRGVQPALRRTRGSTCVGVARMSGGCGAGLGRVEECLKCLMACRESDEVGRHPVARRGLGDAHVGLVDEGGTVRH